MEKLRDIFVFVCFAMGICSLILAVFQAWNEKPISAAGLGLAFAVCGIVVFLSQIKTFKVWQVEVELRETLDRAEEIIGRVRKLASISARASYLTIAWGNRMGTPTAADRQAVLDDIDAQLLELKVTPSERAIIVKPWVRMVRADFFFIFSRVLREFATIKNNSLTSNINASGNREATDAAMRHSDLITAWTRGNGEFDAFERLANQGLSTVLNDYMPKKDGWLSDKELLVINEFKKNLVRLDEECEKKGGYTKEAAQFYDGMTGAEKQTAAEMWQAVSK